MSVCTPSALYYRTVQVTGSWFYFFSVTNVTNRVLFRQEVPIIGTESVHVWQGVPNKYEYVTLTRALLIDVQREFDSEKQKVICSTLRFLAHTNGASLQVSSTTETTVCLMKFCCVFTHASGFSCSIMVRQEISGHWNPNSACTQINCTHVSRYIHVDGSRLVQSPLLSTIYSTYWLPSLDSAPVFFFSLFFSRVHNSSAQVPRKGWCYEQRPYSTRWRLAAHKGVYLI